MSTVPKSDSPAPANNAKTTLLSSDPGLYARPNAGGNASGDAQVAPGAVPANPVMGGIPSVPPPGSLSQAYDSAAYQAANAGAPPSTGGTQVGPDMGHGATQILAQPDATGAPESSTDGGTVGYPK